MEIVFDREVLFVNIETMPFKECKFCIILIIKAMKWGGKRISVNCKDKGEVDKKELKATEVGIKRSLLDDHHQKQLQKNS